MNRYQPEDEIVREIPSSTYTYAWPRTLTDDDIPDPPHVDIMACIDAAALRARYPYPAPAVELPDGSHECAAPRDPLAWQPTEPLPVVPQDPRRRAWTRYGVVACIVPTLALAGDLVGRWWVP